MDKSKNKQKVKKKIEKEGERSKSCFPRGFAVCFGSRRVRFAERTGLALMLWQHEFFMVVEKKPYRGPPKPYYLLVSSIGVQYW